MNKPVDMRGENSAHGKNDDDESERIVLIHTTMTMGNSIFADLAGS